MFDNISFKLNNFSRGRFDKLLSENIGSNYVNRDLIYGKDRLHIRWKNLRVEYFPIQKELWIKNSIHKFHNAQILNWGEFNHDDYKYSSFKETVEYFCETLECKPSDLKLFGRFEYGLNINLKVNPFEIINRFESIVTTASNPFYTVSNPNGKPFERICHFTDYSVKFYDKSKQAQIDGKILRFEIANNKISETRKLFEKENLSLEDLLDINNWNKCFFKLLNTYKLVRKIPLAENLTADEYASIKAYTDPLFMKDHKTILKNEYLYKKVIQQCGKVYYEVLARKGSFFDKLQSDFEQKYIDLIEEKIAENEQKNIKGFNVSLNISINPVFSQ